MTDGSTHPIGQVRLPVTFGERNNQHTELIDFDVADIRPFEKAFLDAGNKVLWDDDSLSVAGVISIEKVKSDPGIYFRVDALDPASGTASVPSWYPERATQ